MYISEVAHVYSWDSSVPISEVPYYNIEGFDDSWWPQKVVRYTNKYRCTNMCNTMYSSSNDVTGFTEAFVNGGCLR